MQNDSPEDSLVQTEPVHKDSLPSEESTQSRPVSREEAARFHILIDPGHGGKDTGAFKWGITEKGLNGAIALQLGNLLQDAGFKISYTRSPQNHDDGLSLAGRVELINRLEPDLIVSIHHNSNPSDIPRGFALFWSSYRPWMDQSDVTVQRGGRNYPWVREEIRDDVTYVYYRNGNKVEETTGDDAYKIFDSSPVIPASESFKLASSIYQEMLQLNHIEAQSFGAKDAAIVDMENRILRLNRAPAVLVECGFMSNREELDLLTEEENQRLTAEAIARGILAYLGTSELEKLDR